MENDKNIDESWKDSVAQEKQQAEDPSQENSSGMMEVNFLNYVTSLGFQAMIFMGEIPHPLTNETDKNMDQAKFLIDTLAMLKDKTKGNLNQQEENLLNASVYELQMKFVETLQKEQGPETA